MSAYCTLNYNTSVDLTCTHSSRAWFLLLRQLVGSENPAHLGSQSQTIKETDRMVIKCTVLELRGQYDSGASAVIPPKTNRKHQRDYDAEAYKWRHLVENYFAKIKEFRGIATRYDKTDCSYAASWSLAAALIASR